MNARTLLLTFGAAFVAALLWSLPLRLLVDGADLRRFGAVAIDTRGRVWDGVLTGVSVRSAPLGDVRLRARFLPLLSGVRRATVEGSGLKGDILTGRLRGVERVSGVLPLAAAAPGSPLSGALRLRNASLVFDRDRCLHAAGGAAAEASLGRGAPVRVEGGLACRERAGIAALRSTGGAPATGVVLRVEADGRYRLTSTVTASDPGARMALQLAGFQPGTAGLTRTDEGWLAR